MIPLAPDAIPHVRAWLGRPMEPALLALYPEGFEVATDHLRQRPTILPE